MIFVPFASSPPPHSLVTKSTGTSSEQIISEGQHIAAQTAGKAPKFTPWTNNPLPIARSGDSIVVPTGRIPQARAGADRKPIVTRSRASGTQVPPRERAHPARTLTGTWRTLPVSGHLHPCTGSSRNQKCPDAKPLQESFLPEGFPPQEVTG